MDKLELANTVKILETMAQLELVVSRFYEMCGAAWNDEAEVWNAVARAEVQHARNIEMMMQLLKKSPGIFTVGRPISAIAVNTVIAGIKNNMEKMKKGDLTRKQVLFILRDIEQSLLESKYTDLIKTMDIGFNSLVQEITSQTEGHKKMLSKKIEEARAGA